MTRVQRLGREYDLMRSTPFYSLSILANSSSYTLRSSSCGAMFGPVRIHSLAGIFLSGKPRSIESTRGEEAAHEHNSFKRDQVISSPPLLSQYPL